MLGPMPVPFRKRKRQSRGPVVNRKAENLAAVGPEAAETADEASPRDGPTQDRTKDRRESPGEYGPL